MGAGLEIFMELNQQKEAFSKAYVRAVSATAGYFVEQPEVDINSIDLRIVGQQVRGTYRSPQLELQLKCISGFVLGDRSLKFPLKVKNYNELRGRDRVVPCILVVVLVPEQATQWLKQSEEQLVLCGCGYWLSLAEAPETTNQSKITVEIPRKNIFNVAGLKNLMQQSLERYN